MYSRPVFLLCFIAALLTALNAGFFYTWSFTIMQSLDLIDQSHSIIAMRSINANIRNGWFAVIFFGSPLLLVICLVALMVVKQYKAALFAALALLCLVGNILITTSIHLPLNAALEAGALSVWQHYSTDWTMSNHWRTITSILGFVFTVIILLVIRSESLCEVTRRVE